MPDAYQAVQSVLRQFSLEASLPHIWRYSRLASQNIPLPRSYGYVSRGAWDKLNQMLHPHKLEVLLRELLIHADHWDAGGSRDLWQWNDLADAVNALNGFSDAVYDPDAEGGIHLTLHRLAHQQFPRFSPLTSPKMGRHLALYSVPAMREVFERHLGLSVESYFVMAFTAIAGSLARPRNNITTDYAIVGIDADESMRFFNLIVGSLADMKAMALKSQRLDECWEYAFNVFQFRPMIALDPARPERVYCPLPPMLEKRLLEGLYYDLVKAEGFGDAFGEAVDAVIGRMLQSLSPAYEVFKPQIHVVKKQTFHGADWIIRNNYHCAFVECKGARISLSGRVAENLGTLRKELGIIADAVVQNYANLHRERQRWGEEGQPQRQFYNLVITLEDWLIFSQFDFEEIYGQVQKRLTDTGLPASLLDEVPFRVMGFEGAQHCCAALAQHPMDEVIGLSNEPKYAGMAFTHELQDRYPNVDAHAVGGFDQDFDALMDPVLERIRVKVQAM